MENLTNTSVTNSENSIVTIGQAIYGPKENRDQFIKQVKKLPETKQVEIIASLQDDYAEIEEMSSFIHTKLDSLQKLVAGREIIATSSALALFDLFEHLLGFNRFDLFDLAGIVILGPILGLLLRKYITKKYGKSGMQGTDKMKEKRIQEIISALEE